LCTKGTKNDPGKGNAENQQLTAFFGMGKKEDAKEKIDSARKKSKPTRGCRVPTVGRQRGRG